MLHCLESLERSTYPHFQVFIVDNQSTDNSLEAIQAGCERLGISFVSIISEAMEADTTRDPLGNAKVVLIQNEVNRGFAAGNNCALRFLLRNRSNEYVWLLNPDVEVEKEVLQDLVTLHGNRDKVLVGNLIHYFDQPDKVMYCGGFQVNRWFHGIRNVITSENMNKLDAIAGTSIFTNLDTFRDLGLLPEDYFLYWEETDFCTRALRQGYHFDVNTKSIILDRVGATSDSNFTREYLYILSGLRYYRKFYTGHLPVLLLSTFAKQMKALIFGPKLKSRAICFGNIDFIKLWMGRPIDVKRRIKEQ